MPSAFEDNLAKLISRIDDLGARLANAPAVREQLSSIKTDIQNLCRQAVAESRHIEFTDRSRVERENYNKVLFDQSHQPIAVVDPESGYFIDANRAAAKIFGYSSPQEIIGKTPLDMAAPTQYNGSDSADASRRRDRSALQQGIESFEWRHRRPNGEIWDRHDNLTVARAIYRGRVCQYPGRLVKLRNRARVPARSDQPETMP